VLLLKEGEGGCGWSRSVIVKRRWGWLRVIEEWIIN